MATTPQVAPVALHAAYLENFVGRGAWFPRGGGQMLSAAFSEVIRGHGGEVRTHCQVEKILVEGGRVTGVRLTGGEVLRAPVVVSDADLRRTYRDLVGYEHLPRLLALRCERWRMSPPLINAFFGIELDLTGTPNSNYFAIPDWDGASSLLSLERMTRRLLRDADRRDPFDWAADYARHQPGFVQCSTRRDPSNRRSAPPMAGTSTVWGPKPPSPESSARLLLIAPGRAVRRNPEARVTSSKTRWSPEPKAGRGPTGASTGPAREEWTGLTVAPTAPKKHGFTALPSRRPRAA